MMDKHALMEALALYEDGEINNEFSYGVLDCCLFVCDVIHEVTGIDYAKHYRGHYRGATGAYRLIQRQGNGSLTTLLIKVFGRVHPIWSVKIGDPVILPTGLVEQDNIGAGIGIYDGTDIVYLTDKGLHRAPITAGRGCFNV